MVKSDKIQLRLTFVACFAASLFFHEPIRAALYFLPFFPWLDAAVLKPVFTQLVKTFSKPWMYPPIFLILFLEYRFPARPGQKLFSVGFVHDSVWFVVQIAMSATITAGYVTLLRELYHDKLDFLTIDAMNDWPFAGKFAVWLLVSDFLMWFHHWVRHKVTWFWHFHTVHHSQKQMNQFTDMRYHAVEYLIAETINAIPILMVQADVNAAFGFGFIHRWYTRLYHGNIRSDFGILRYFLVTPQSHRIHHSIERKHADVNFGVFFSFWDRLFGTHYEPGKDEYPETGIRDEDFPLETQENAGSLLTAPIRQHLYPFRAIARDVRRPAG